MYFNIYFTYVYILVFHIFRRHIKLFFKKFYKDKKNMSNAIYPKTYTIELKKSFLNTNMFIKRTIKVYLKNNCLKTNIKSFNQVFDYKKIVNNKYIDLSVKEKPKK